MTDYNSPHIFRYVIGAIVIVGGLVGLGGLYYIAIPDGNKEPLLLALGIILGWGATVIGYEFGSSPAARRAADAGITASSGIIESGTRMSEQAATAAVEQANDRPTGTTKNPIVVEGAGAHAEPVPIIGSVKGDKP